MPVNLQTTCYNCTKVLPQEGYFCGGCLTQFRCKACGSLLEKDCVGCINCGAPKEIRGKASSASQQNINTFSLQETTNGRTIEATFSDNVGKDLAEILRDAAGANRRKAIAYSNIQPIGDLNEVQKDTSDFQEAEILDSQKGVPETDNNKKSATSQTVKSEEYPTLKAVAMKNLPSSETEWVVVYSFYASLFGKETFTRQNLIEKYKESNRLDSGKKSALSSYITRAVQGNFLNPLANGYSILNSGIVKAKEVLGRTTGSSTKSRISSKREKEDTDNHLKNETKNFKKPSKVSKTLKRLTNINFAPKGKESLEAFFAKYSPSSDDQRNLLFVYYLQNILEESGISVNHVYSCYDILKLRISENLPQTVRNTASKKGWIETKNAILSVTVKGSNQIKEWNKEVKE